MTDLLQSPRQQCVDIRNMVDNKEAPLRLIFWYLHIIKQGLDFSAPLLGCLSEHMLQRLGHKQLTKNDNLVSQPLDNISDDIHLGVLIQAYSSLHPEKNVAEIGSGDEPTDVSGSELVKVK